MTPVEAVRAAITERNREITLDAGIEIGMGVAYGLFTCAFIFWLTWIASAFRGSFLGLPSWLLAAIVTGLFAVVTTHQAWRRVDPLDAIEPMSDMEELVMVLSLATPKVMIVDPRRAIAGAAWFLLGGPANVFSGIATLRHRLPDDRAVIHDAAQMLADAERGLAVSSITDPRAATVLRRLMLIRSDPGRRTATIVLTEAGRTLLHR